MNFYCTVVGEDGGPNTPLLVKVQLYIIRLCCLAAFLIEQQVSKCIPLYISPREIPWQEGPEIKFGKCDILHHS